MVSRNHRNKIPNKEIKYGVSLLSADFSRLGDEVVRLHQSDIDTIHLDIMDGHFVPHLTLGPKMVRDLRPYTSKPFDVHLMLTHPQRYLDAFLSAGADILTVHREAAFATPKDLLAVLQKIRSHGKKASLAFNPETPLTDLPTYLPALDQVLLMSVSPGFAGQTFLTDVLHRGRTVRKWIDQSPYSIDLQVDGGVNAEHAPAIKDVGFDVLIAGSYLYRSDDFSEALRRLQNAPSSSRHLS